MRGSPASDHAEEVTQERLTRPLGGVVAQAAVAGADQVVAELVVAEDLGHRLGREGRARAGRQQQAGVAEGFGYGAAAAGQHRDVEGHRLEERYAEPLVLTGRREQVGTAIEG